MKLRLQVTVLNSDCIRVSKHESGIRIVLVLVNMLILYRSVSYPINLNVQVYFRFHHLIMSVIKSDSSLDCQCPNSQVGNLMSLGFRKIIAYSILLMGCWLHKTTWLTDTTCTLTR